MILPTDEDATLPLYPGEEALDQIPVAHRPAGTLSNVKGKRDAPSLPANVHFSRAAICSTLVGAGNDLIKPTPATRDRCDERGAR
jgi:hypothetical protein